MPIIVKDVLSIKIKLFSNESQSGEPTNYVTFFLFSKRELEYLSVIFRKVQSPMLLPLFIPLTGQLMQYMVQIVFHLDMVHYLSTHSTDCLITITNRQMQAIFHNRFTCVKKRLMMVKCMMMVE